MSSLPMWNLLGGCHHMMLMQHMSCQSRSTSQQTHVRRQAWRNCTMHTPAQVCTSWCLSRGKVLLYSNVNSMTAIGRIRICCNEYHDQLSALHPSSTPPSQSSAARISDHSHVLRQRPGSSHLSGTSVGLCKVSYWLLLICPFLLSR